MGKKLKPEKYIKYVSDQERFVSVLRQIPMDYLENVRKTVKDILSIAEHETNTKLEVRIRFRGPRYWTNGMHTLKLFAEAFDVYVDTKKFPASASKRVKREISRNNRESIIRGLENQHLLFW